MLGICSFCRPSLSPPKIFILTSISPVLDSVDWNNHSENVWRKVAAGPAVLISVGQPWFRITRKVHDHDDQYDTRGRQKHILSEDMPVFQHSVTPGSATNIITDSGRPIFIIWCLNRIIFWPACYLEFKLLSTYIIRHILTMTLCRYDGINDLMILYW